MLAWLVLLLHCLTGSESHTLLDSFAWEVFEEAGVLDLEFEIAACLAPQLSVDSRDRDLHFIEDLGVDSGSLGRLISQTRSKPRLQRSDLQMLLEHPTVRSIAALLSLQSAELDSKGEDIPRELNAFQDSLAREVFEEAGASDLELEIAACLAQLSADSWSQDSHFMEDSLACEVFEEAGTSDPEMEITACLAPQLSVGSWNLDSHFMEDLGADSEDLGRMISQARSDLSLQKIDLQMLSEHPTVRSLAVRSSLQSAKSDSEDEDKVTPGESNTLLDSSPRAAEQPSHATCLEVGQQSLSYLQLSGGFGTDFGADSLMGKTWERGKTVSDKKFSHNIIDNSKVPTEPFYVATITPVIHYCIGGLVCTMEAKCVDRSGKPIPGPRMAGEATAGLHGSYRLGGNSLLGYVVFGRVAGQGLAAYMNFQVEQFPDVYAELSTSDMFSAGMTMAVAITAPWNYTLIRFFIGCAGATFVTNQFWRSPMFTPNVVGTANATAAGWGNLGSGVTQICRMSVIFNPMVEEGLETNVVWRVSMVVLAVMSVICAVCMKLLCWDMPIGKHYDPVITGKTHEPSMWDYVKALKDIVAANSCHCFVSVSMLLSAMFAVQDLPHECVHGWLQLCFEATCLTVFAFPYIHVGSMRDLMKWSMVVPFCCGMLLTSILALKTTPMSLVIVLRNTSPLITLLIARFYPEQLRSNTDVLVSILVMIMGGLMYVSQSSRENWQGIGWIFLSSGFAVVDRLLRRLSLPKNQHPVDISKTGATLINNYVGLLPVGLAAYMNGEVQQFPDVYAELSTSDMFYTGMTMAVAITAPWHYSLIGFFIGCAGATFITNQFWRSPMFAPNVVGTANATAAGWGNLGSGVTQFFRMSVIFNPMVEEGLEPNVVWRVSMVMPAVMSMICAVCVKLLCWDMPIGKHYVPAITGKTHEPSMWDYVEALKDIVAANSCHCFVSVSMLLSAKFAVQDLPHECVLVWLQLRFAATCLTVFAFPYIHVGSMRDLMKWSMVVPFCCGMLLTSILALKTAQMSLVIVLRNTSPLITLVIESFYPEQLRSNTDVLASILVMIMGGLMYVSQSSHENWQEIGWIFLSNGIAVVDRLLRRLLLSKDQHPVHISKTGTTLIHNYVGMLPVGLAGYMRGEVEQFPAVYAKLSTLDKFYVGMAMATAITAPWNYTLIRFFTGCAGATFVTNQFWCSLMFALNVVGTAINTAAGQATMPSLHASYSARWVFSSSSTLPVTTNRAELGPKSQHRGNKQCHLLFALLLLLTQITLAAGAVIDPGKPRVIIGPATMMGASTERSSSANTGEAKTCGKGLQRQRLAIQKIAFRRATARAQREGLTQPLLYCAKIE